MKALVAALSVLVLVLIGIVLYFTVFKNSSQSTSQLTTNNNATSTANEPATLSGTIDFNGVVPDGSTISIGVKKAGDQTFTIIAQNVAVKDNVSWSWNGAQAGSHYDIQAYLQVAGKSVAESEILNAVAPASEESLTINAPAPPKPVQTPATLSGVFDLNGYIPSGTTLQVVQRLVGTTAFTTVVSGLPAKDGSAWTWNNAVAGNSYELKAQLVQNGSVLSESKTKALSAPAANEVLTIRSTVTPPQQAQQTPQGGPISGTINLNGVVPPGASLTIVTRQSGQGNFTTTISGLSAQNGTQWTWTAAKPGVSYDIQGVLNDNKGNVFAVSNTVSTAPPALNEVLTINSNPAQPAPTQYLQISCVGQQNNLWSAKVTFNNVPNAASYWVRVGDASVDNRYLDTQFAPVQNQSNQSVSTAYVLGNAATYFAKFAYTQCANCNNLNNFSPWSNVAQFSCPQTNQ